MGRSSRGELGQMPDVDVLRASPGKHFRRFSGGGLAVAWWWPGGGLAVADLDPEMLGQAD